MSTEPHDIYEYRAALLEWHQENVGQAQLIFVANDSHALLQEIRDDVLRYANSLTHHHAQVIDAVDLSAIQRHFSSDELPDRFWNHEDVQRLLRDFIREKLMTLSTYSRYQSILGEWYDLIEWLNDLLPGKNHVMLSIEDSVPHFVHRLWDKYFDVETVYDGDQSPRDIIWLGKLALLQLCGSWWEQPDGMHFFYQLLDATQSGPPGKRQRLTFQCTWRIASMVNHWGHTHQRRNQYEARITLQPIEHTWKMVALDLINERRLPRLTRRRLLLPLRTSRFRIAKAISTSTFPGSKSTPVRKRS